MFRDIKPYDPCQDAAARWGSWRIELVDLRGVGEVMDRRTQTILIDPHEPCRREFAIAHALSHLDLAHHLAATAEFTEQQCADADGLARLRLYSQVC